MMIVDFQTEFIQFNGIKRPLFGGDQVIYIEY